MYGLHFLCVLECRAMRKRILYFLLLCIYCYQQRAKLTQNNTCGESGKNHCRLLQQLLVVSVRHLKGSTGAVSSRKVAASKQSAASREGEGAPSAL